MRQIIYVPTLHSSLAPAGLPEELLFVCPGLNGCPPGAFKPAALPFAGREASAVLEELLALGLEFSKNGDLKLVAGQGWLEREEKRKEAMRAEGAALREFAEGNRWTRAAAESGLSEISQAEQFRNAQKALLLAWEHEEEILAVRALEAKVAEGEERLRSALGDGADDGSGGGPAALAAQPVARPAYSWRIVLDAIGAFLPEGAALFTACAAMIDDLRGLGILEPLPENLRHEMPAGFSGLAEQLLTAELPLWRILGYAALPGDRPWLGAVCTLFAAPRLAEDA